MVRKGRVRAVAVVRHSLARRSRALRTANPRLLSAKATQGPPAFVPSAAQAATRGAPTGRTLSGTSDPQLNAAFAFLCNLQVRGA